MTAARRDVPQDQEGRDSPRSRRLKMAVVGATFLDAVYRIPVEPRLGKTVYATDAVTMPGGKGLNQAIGAAAYGNSVEVTFITAIGIDGQGERIKEYLESPNQANPPFPRSPVSVCGAHIRATPTCTILVAADKHGMLAPPPASHREALTPADFDGAALSALQDAEVVLVTLDFPAVVETVIRYATGHDDDTPRERRPLLVLNAAPAIAAGAVKYSDLREFDWIVPNVAEARAMLGLASATRGDERRAYDADLPLAEKLAVRIRDEFDVSACVTASAAGCAWAPKLEANERRHEMAARRERPPGVLPADVTGASDAFCATLAYRLARIGRVFGPDRFAHYADAVRQAAAAGSLAVERLGSSYAMPTPDAIARLLQRDVSQV